jgi:hypothetical protein
MAHHRFGFARRRPKRERSTSGNKHNKFGSVSKALQLQPRIQFRQASASFYPLFQQWLEFFGQKVPFGHFFLFYFYSYAAFFIFILIIGIIDISKLF